ncbi:MAG: hypothetical protein CR997_03720 [Acidobacteria bacterium]|nr:MAG: hypothetical protein CR997_03720 [Acidobacteriota bacterium]
MKHVLFPGEMAAADHYTIRDLGVPGIELMARAGSACVDILHPRLQKSDSIMVIAGTGNNGGDAFVMATLLKKMGYQLSVLVFGSENKLKPDARTFYNAYRKTGGQLEFSTEGLVLDLETTWIVDGLFGTGLNGTVRGPAAQWISAMNSSDANVFSIDIPSGLLPGANPKLGVQADVCVTFHALKPAHVLSPGCFRCGDLFIANIGISSPPHFQPAIHYLEPSDFSMPVREPDTHKGSFGTLAVLGGAKGMEGASALAGSAALRMGAGKVRIYSENPNSPKFSTAALMVESWQGDFSKEPYHAWIVGPGMSKREDIHSLIAKANLADKPSLWDADGLNYLDSIFKHLPHGSWIMTPHPGEAARLLAMTSGEVQQDRLAALKKLGEKYRGGWILLKGARSMILSPAGEIWVIATGNPSLAVAGSGDVLAGMIGGLLSQGFSCRDALINGALRHGLAAENWVAKHADYAMIPEDIIEDLKNPVQVGGTSVPTILGSRGVADFEK